MAKHYKTYDALFKIECVEEFLKMKEADPDNIGYYSYSLSKGIEKSTFLRWVQKYKENKAHYYGIKDDNVISETDIDSYRPRFIELSPSVISEQSAGQKSTDSALMRLMYKDVSIEFKVNDLDKVMEALRKW